MNEYPLTELMHAINRECKSGEPKVKSARIYTKDLKASDTTSRLGVAPKSYPLTALTAFPEQGVITIDVPLKKEGKDVPGYGTRYVSLSDVELIEVFEED